jgi:hypothetical protein
VLGDGSQIGHGEYLARVVAVASVFPIGENERSSEGRSCHLTIGTGGRPLPVILTVTTRSGWTSQWFRGGRGATPLG